MIDSIQSFSADYAEARSKFCRAAADAGGAMELIEHPERGPSAERLFVDVARFGAKSAENVLVMISGTHGVEGFCGSGAQIDFLRRQELNRLPANVAVLMIHAINPFGFAWLRRTTHENIDLNRNWIDFTSPLPVNDGYREIHSFICPRDWTEDSLKLGEDAIQYMADSRGSAAAKQAVSGGQYEFSDGIYFGGLTESWSRKTQTAIFEDQLGNASRVAILDYHTGLGPWGFAEQIMSAPPGSAAFRTARDWYGRSVSSTVDGSSTAARIGGDGMEGAVALLPQADVVAMVIEIGTLERHKVVGANRADNWLSNHGDPLSASAGPIKQGIRDAYYGDAPDWKGMVAGQSLMICRQAIAGLASP